MHAVTIVAVVVADEDVVDHEAVEAELQENTKDAKVNTQDAKENIKDASQEVMGTLVKAVIDVAVLEDEEEVKAEASSAVVEAVAAVVVARVAFLPPPPLKKLRAKQSNLVLTATSTILTPCACLVKTSKPSWIDLPWASLLLPPNPF